MAWLSSVSWVTGDTPVLATVLNNIGADIRTWGGNVDAGTYQLTNCGGIRTVAGASVGIGTPSPLRVLHVASSGLSVELILDHTAQAADARKWRFMNTGGEFSIGAVNDAITTETRALTIARTGRIKLGSTPVYADNTAAIAGGLVAGTVYRTSTGDLREVY